MQCPYIKLKYTVDGIAMDYPISLEITRPHFGGIRWWFKCPARGCNSRVAVLYGAKHFLCRSCLRIAYNSQNQPAYLNLCDRAYKLAEKLGLQGDVIRGFKGKKPKGIHSRTFAHKLEEIELAAHRSLKGITDRLNKE